MFKLLNGKTASTEAACNQDGVDDFRSHVATTTAGMLTAVESIQQLDSLRTAIETYGLSKSLVAFADYNRILSSSGVCPAVEGLHDNDATQQTLVVSNITNSIDALDIATEGLIGDIISVMKQTLVGMFSTAAAIKVAIGDVKKNVANKTLDVERLKTSKMNTIPYSVLQPAEKSFLSLSDILVKLWSTDIPTTEEEYAVWIKKVKADLGAFMNVFGMELSDDGKFTESSGLFNKNNKRSDLFDLGYNSDTVFNNLITTGIAIADNMKTYGKVESTATKALKEIEKTWGQKDVDKKVVRRAKYVMYWFHAWAINALIDFAANGLPGIIRRMSKAYV